MGFSKLLTLLGCMSSAYAAEPKIFQSCDWPMCEMDVCVVVTPQAKAKIAQAGNLNLDWHGNIIVWDGNPRTAILNALNIGNVAYNRQLKVNLNLNGALFMTSGNDAADNPRNSNRRGGGCTQSVHWQVEKFEKYVEDELQAQRPECRIWKLIDYCNNLADFNWVSGYATTGGTLPNYSVSWYTYPQDFVHAVLHEIGRNLNGRHPATTGGFVDDGLMAYGDGSLVAPNPAAGKVGFADINEDQMCPWIKNSGLCPLQAPPTPPPTPKPSPSPTPNPTPAPVVVPAEQCNPLKVLCPAGQSLDRSKKCTGIPCQNNAQDQAKCCTAGNDHCLRTPPGGRLHCYCVADPHCRSMNGPAFEFQRDTGDWVFYRGPKLTVHTRYERWGSRTSGYTSQTATVLQGELTCGMKIEIFPRLRAAHWGVNRDFQIWMWGNSVATGNPINALVTPATMVTELMACSKVCSVTPGNTIAGGNSMTIMFEGGSEYKLNYYQGWAGTVPNDNTQYGMNQYLWLRNADRGSSAVVPKTEVGICTSNLAQNWVSAKCSRAHPDGSLFVTQPDQCSNSRRRLFSEPLQQRRRLITREDQSVLSHATKVYEEGDKLWFQGANLGYQDCGDREDCDENIIISGNPLAKTKITIKKNLDLTRGTMIEIIYQYGLIFQCGKPRNPLPIKEPHFDIMIGDFKVGETQGPYLKPIIDMCENPHMKKELSHNVVRTLNLMEDVSGDLTFKISNNIYSMAMKIVAFNVGRLGQRSKKEIEYFVGRKTDENCSQVCEREDRRCHDKQANNIDTNAEIARMVSDLAGQHCEEFGESEFGPYFATESVEGPLKCYVASDRNADHCAHSSSDFDPQPVEGQFICACKLGPGEKPDKDSEVVDQEQEEKDLQNPVFEDCENNKKQIWDDAQEYCGRCRDKGDGFGDLGFTNCVFDICANDKLSAGDSMVATCKFDRDRRTSGKRKKTMVNHLFDSYDGDDSDCIDRTEMNTLLGALDGNPMDADEFQYWLDRVLESREEDCFTREMFRILYDEPDFFDREGNGGAVTDDVDTLVENDDIPALPEDPDAKCNDNEGIEFFRTRFGGFGEDTCRFVVGEMEWKCEWTIAQVNDDCPSCEFPDVDKKIKDMCRKTCQNCVESGDNCGEDITNKIKTQKEFDTYCKTLVLDRTTCRQQCAGKLKGRKNKPKKCKLKAKKARKCKNITDVEFCPNISGCCVVDGKCDGVPDFYKD